MSQIKVLNYVTWQGQTSNICESWPFLRDNNFICILKYDKSDNYISIWNILSYRSVI